MPFFTLASVLQPTRNKVNKKNLEEQSHVEFHNR